MSERDWSDSVIIEVAEFPEGDVEMCHVSKTSDGTIFKDVYPLDGSIAAYMYENGEKIDEDLDFTVDEISEEDIENDFVPFEIIFDGGIYVAREVQDNGHGKEQIGDSVGEAILNI